VGEQTVTRVAARVPDGAVIAVALPAERERRVHVGEAAALSILYEDDCLLAVDKPAGVVVHPSFGHARGTLLNALLWHARDWPVETRPAPVHRLDKHTSGVLLVAKTPAVHAQLTRALGERRVEKDYLAVVAGRVPRARGEIRLGVERDPANRRRMIASPSSARVSVTQYERVASPGGPGAGVSVLRCRLVTGRMHQVRVHLAAAGWPILGDPVYGPPASRRFDDHEVNRAAKALERQALHAWRVAFSHPVTGEPIEIVAPLPDDMRRLLAAAGVDLSGVERRIRLKPDPHGRA
jgi:23S rRNA pseudouridine1911/1915/1917 synthase